MRRALYVCLAVVVSVALFLVARRVLRSEQGGKAIVPADSGQKGPPRESEGLPKPKTVRTTTVCWPFRSIGFSAIPGTYESGDWKYSLQYVRPASRPDGQYALYIYYKGVPITGKRWCDRVETPWGVAYYEGGGRWLRPGFVGFTLDELSRGRDVTPADARPVRPASRPTKADIVRDAIRGIRHTEWRVRVDSIRSLGKLGQDAAKAVPELVRLIESGEGSGLPCCAVEALGRIGPAAAEALPALARLSDGADPNIRSALVWAFVRIAPESTATRAYLEKAAQDTEESVRRAAASAKKSLGIHSRDAGAGPYP